MTCAACWTSSFDAEICSYFNSIDIKWTEGVTTSMGSGDSDKKISGVVSEITCQGGQLAYQGWKIEGEIKSKFQWKGPFQIEGQVSYTIKREKQQETLVIDLEYTVPDIYKQ